MTRRVSALVPLGVILLILSQPVHAAPGGAQSSPIITQVTGAVVETSGFTYDPANGFTYVENVDNHIPVISGNQSVGDVLVNPDTIPAYMGVDTANGDVYAAEAGSDIVSVISGTQLIANVTVGSAPSALVFDPADGYMYATINGSVAVISGTQVVASVTTGGAPFAAVYDSANNYVYVSNSGSDTISVISGTKNIANIPVKSAPGYLLYDPANGYVYVGDDGCSCHAPGVSVISGVSMIGLASSGMVPYSMAYDQSNGLVYVTNGGSASVSVINGTTNVANVTVGANPTTLSYNPYDGRIYAIVQGTNSISVISGMSVAGSITSSDFGSAQAPGINAISCDTGGDDCYVGVYSSLSVYLIALGSTPTESYTTLTTFPAYCGGAPLATYEGYVYWANTCNWEIQRVSEAGGAVQNITSVPGNRTGTTLYVDTFAFSGPFIFWTEWLAPTKGGLDYNGSLVRAPVWGGPAQVLAVIPGGTGGGLVVQGDNVYFFDGINLMRVSIFDTGLTTLLPNASPAPWYLTASGENVYWYDPALGSVYSASILGFGRTLLAGPTDESQEPFFGTQDMVVSGQSVLWADASSGSLNEVSVNGGSSTLLYSCAACGIVYNLADAGSQVAYAQLGAQSTSVWGVFLLPRTGGVPVQLVSAEVADMTVSGSSVFFSEVNATVDSINVVQLPSA